MATTPSAACKTCTLRAGAPVFVPRELSERSAAGFKLNPQAAEYKASKDQQALNQLLNILTDASISEREEHSDGSAEPSGERGEEPGSVASSPGRTYAASSASDTLVDDASGHVVVSGSEGAQVSPRQGVLHHHHIHHHHHPHRRHTDRREVHVHHAEFVGSVMHIEHARHALPHVHRISSEDMHVQPRETTHHVPNPYRPCPAPGTFSAIPSGIPVPDYRPIPCEAYLLDHPLRDTRTGYWEVPKAQPIKYRYNEADLALFRSTHKDYKQANGIALYGQTSNGSQNQGVVNSQGQTMAREYHAQNTYEYCDLESGQKVCGRAKGVWYGWY